MSELERCPFCGGKCYPAGWAKLNDKDDDSYDQGPECESCGATAQSIESWNHRAIPEGYALVPVEPTQAMIYEIAIHDQFTNKALIARYKAMLKAAKCPKQE